MCALALGDGQGVSSHSHDSSLEKVDLSEVVRNFSNFEKSLSRSPEPCFSKQTFFRCSAPRYMGYRRTTRIQCRTSHNDWLSVLCISSHCSRTGEAHLKFQWRVWQNVQAKYPVQVPLNPHMEGPRKSQMH